MNILKKIAGIACAFMMIGAAAAHAQQNDFERILKEKVVRIGAVDSFPSYRKNLSTGKWDGIMPEIAELVFGSIGVKVEYVDAEWSSAAAGLQSGRFDIIGGFSATPARALVVSFTDELARTDIGVASVDPAKPSVQSWAEIINPNVSIAVADGSGSMRTAERMAPKAKIVALKNEAAAILEIESKRADYFLTNSSSLSRYQASRGADKVKLFYPAPVVYQPVVFAARKDQDDLIKWLNIAFGYYVSDGSIPSIRQKYLTMAN